MVIVVDERTKTILFWIGFILIIIGLRVLCDYVLVVLPPPEIIEVRAGNLSVFNTMEMIP